MRRIEQNELVTAIKQSIEGIYQASKGHWVSVLDVSLADIHRDSGLPKNYWKAFLEVLKGNGLIVSEGERAGMRYKMGGELIQDYTKLAELIIDLQKVYSKEYRDTLPKKSGKKKEIVEDNNLIVINKGNIPLGTKVFFLIGQVPYQGIISDIRYGINPDDLDKVYYRVRFRTTIHPSHLPEGTFHLPCIDDITYLTQLLRGKAIGLTLEEIFERMKKDLVTY